MTPFTLSSNAPDAAALLDAAAAEFGAAFDLPLVATPALTTTQPPDARGFDPIAVASLLLTFPQTALAVADIAERLALGSRLHDLLQRLRALSGAASLVFTLPSGRRLSLGEANPALLASAAPAASPATPFAFRWFLAAAPGDEPFALELHSALLSHGDSVFGPKSLQPGDEPAVVIPSALDRAHTTVFLLRKATSADDLSELIARAVDLQRATPLRRRIVPVWLDGLPMRANVPYGLGNLTPFDAQGRKPRAIAQALCRLPGPLTA